MDIDFPFQIDGRGRTSVAGDHHIRDLMEQLLFTSPGERVNRPTLGSGLLQMVFAPSSDELAAATQFLLQGTLQQWLGDVIQAEAVRVEFQDSTLLVTVQFVVRATGVRQVVKFSKGI
jgi:phage baseplate assembly protein W